VLASGGNVIAKGLQSSYSDPWAAAAIGQPGMISDLDHARYFEA
jgi:hypothetical protein